MLAAALCDERAAALQSEIDGLSVENDATAKRADELMAAKVAALRCGSDIHQRALRMLIGEREQVDLGYLIWSNTRCQYWGPGGHGFVSDPARAGRYTRAQALTTYLSAVPGTERLPELPIRLADVTGRFG